MEEIGQYYVLTEKSSQTDCIVYDSPDFDMQLDPELPFLGHVSSLQTIFFSQGIRKTQLLRHSGASSHSLGPRSFRFPAAR